MGQATWAVPDLPAARSLLDRLSDLVEAGSPVAKTQRGGRKAHHMKEERPDSR